ncbi:hypothetical protein BC937DRAFT_92691, partial [Endogone sp. FLAS-F59071]
SVNERGIVGILKPPTFYSAIIFHSLLSTRPVLSPISSKASFPHAFLHTSKMKFLASLALFAAAAQATVITYIYLEMSALTQNKRTYMALRGDECVVTPWNTTTWQSGKFLTLNTIECNKRYHFSTLFLSSSPIRSSRSGGAGLITWNSTSGGGADFTTCSIDLLNGDPKAANLVAHITSTPILVSLGQFQITPIQDFASGNNYWIRIGNTGEWFYSGTFTFQGKGTIPPLSAASSGATAAAPTGVGITPVPYSSAIPATASKEVAAASSSLQASISAAAVHNAAPAMSGASTAVVLSAVGAAVVAMML